MSITVQFHGDDWDSVANEAQEFVSQYFDTDTPSHIPIAQPVPDAPEQPSAAGPSGLHGNSAGPLSVSPAPAPVLDIPIAPPAAPPTPNTPKEPDSAGVPWDSRIHAGNFSKLKTGCWRRKRNTDDAVYAAVMAEIAPPTTPVAPPTIPAPPPPLATPAPDAGIYDQLMAAANACLELAQAHGHTESVKGNMRAMVREHGCEDFSALQTHTDIHAALLPRLQAYQKQLAEAYGQ